MMYKRVALLSVGAALIVSMTACGKDNDLTRDHNGVRSQSMDRMNNIDLTRDGIRYDLHESDDHARKDSVLNARDIDKQQEKLLQHVREVNGVHDATVFVNGNDIVVGLDVDSSSKAAEVEKSVRKALQDDNADYTVHVTSDAKMHDRIRQIKGQMVPMDGHPIRNMAQDITDLLKDMGEMVTEPLR